ncbi:MAG: pyruvoyl-dependent arginine decarboxylase [Candidatus Aenigmatarchaeota archaeon]
MQIKVTWGTGKADTEEGAFDKALYEAGLANYNLIEMSSIVPEGSQVKLEQLDTDTERYGDKAYVVLSKCLTTEEGSEAWAGLGWHYHEKEQKGVFVEEEAGSESELSTRIRKTVETLHSERMKETGELNMKTAGIESDGRPVCAVVAALYRIESW